MAAVCALTVLCAPVLSAERLQPDIQPGHNESVEGLEAGIWMQVQKYERRVRTSPHTSGDPEMAAYLHRLVCQLAPDYCDDIRVYVLRSANFNAGMAPNGLMLVNTGLLLRAQNEAQLVAVLGHELGHYLKQHGLKNFRNAKNTASVLSFLTLGLAAGGQFYGAQGAQYAALFAVFGFGREQEREADIFGSQLMYDAGYDPRQAATVWNNLIEEDEAAKYKRHRSLFFSTHPSSSERVGNLSQHAVALLAESGRTRVAETEFEALMASRRKIYMQDDLDQRRFGRSEVVLSRLQDAGVQLGEVLFYKGELYRLRNGERDRENAMAQYKVALTFDDVPPEIHRSMGMLLLKEKQRDEAIEEFRTYLDLVPDATDREMVEMYMGWGG